MAPVVMNGFFLVYSLTGWAVEGRDKLNWALEAESVATWVGMGILIYSLAVMAYARWRGAARWHILNISSWGHIAVAALLVASVFISVRL
jgi:putative copper export protein